MDIEPRKHAHRSIKTGRNDILRQLLDDGADVESSNHLGWTLLMLAALEGNTTAGRHLIDRGADVSATNQFGENPLMHAAHKGHVRFMELLLEAGGRLPTHIEFDEYAQMLRVSAGLPDAKVDSIIQLLSNRQSASARDS